MALIIIINRSSTAYIRNSNSSGALNSFAFIITTGGCTLSDIISALMPSDISRRADSPLKYRFQIKSNQIHLTRQSRVHFVSHTGTNSVPFISAISPSRNFIMNSNAPRQTLCTRRGRYDNSCRLLLENHRRRLIVQQ